MAEKRLYVIKGSSFSNQPDVVVHLAYPPPCLWCAKAVFTTSTDEPLICAFCDIGVNQDGTPWTSAQHLERSKHYADAIERYRRDAATQPGFLDGGGETLS
jgi:hypothetical protein